MKSAKNDYLDFSPPVRVRQYNWAEWEKIPPGKAVDITDIVKQVGNLRPSAAKRGLIVYMKNNRVYIGRPA